MLNGLPLPKFGLSLLGRFELTGPDGVIDLQGKKVAALLAYLACTAPHPQPRERLSTLLWGSHFDTQAKQNLRQALFRLRKILGENAVESDGEVVSLNGAAVQCDVSRFEALIHDGSRDALGAAVDLYRGRLIDDVIVSEEGWNEWLSGERERFLELALGLIMKLGEQELDVGGAAYAIKAAQRAIALNNMREDAHRLLMRALATTGRKAEALRHYRDLVELLRLELDTEPDAATRSLVAELRSMQPPNRSSAVTELPQVSAEKPVAPGDAAASEVPVRAAGPERRQLTVMACNLAGLARISAHLDPEDMRDLIATLHSKVAETAARFGGFVAQYLSDGILVYFGYPIANEHDAEQAVRAGLATIDAVNTQKALSDVPLQVCVGIASGLVVIGEQGGPGSFGQHVAIGETPNLATLLQAAAAPSEIIIAASTRQLVGRMFDCHALDAGVLGAGVVMAPLAEAWQVRGEAVGISRFEARRAGTLSHLVGRHEEIELLLRRWGQAKTGEGRVVLLSGEPGIGKSRIAESLLATLEGEPHARLRYFCSPHHHHTALYPFITQLERAVSFEAGSNAQAKLDRLEAWIKMTATDLPRDLALVAELLAVPADARCPAPDISPQQKRELTLTVLLNQIDRVAVLKPALILFEDVHWIDPTSQDLLDRMVARIAGLPVLLVVTMRPELQPGWIGEPHVTMLSLSRLSSFEGAGVIAGVTKGRSLPGFVAEQILTRADGVPLFIEELTSGVLESGVLRETADRYELNKPLPPLAIPATLQASLVARLDRLGSVKDLAQIGAAIGREFSHELISAVASWTAAELETALERLIASGLISRRGTPPGATYSFKHALVRDAAYSTLVKSRRQFLHTGIARVLVERFAATVESLPETAAYHFTEAHLASEAIGFWLKAGERAIERSADQEAISHLERGLVLLATLPESTERDRCELEFQVALGSPLVAVSGYTSLEVWAVCQRAAILSEKLGDVARLFASLYAQFSYCNATGQTYKALEFAERCQALGMRQGDRVMHLLAHRGVGIVLFQLGKFALAKKELEQAVALYQPERDRALGRQYITDPFAGALSLLAIIAWISGFPDRATIIQAQALDYAHALNHSNTSGFVHFVAGAAFEQLRGNAAAVLTHTRVLRALATEHGVLAWHSSGAIVEGWALSLDTGPDSGIPSMQKGIADVDARNLTFFIPSFASLLAQVHARAGNFVAALALCVDARERAQRSEQYIWEAELHRVDGEVRHAAGHSTVEVEACFCRSLDVSRVQGAKMFELRAATSLARLWSEHGRHAEARDLLAPIHGLFIEGFNTVDLNNAKAVLDKADAYVNRVTP